MITRIFLSAALLLLSLLALPATAAPGATPKQVYLDYADAVRQSGLAEIPKFIHPDELTRFRTMILPLFATEPGSEGVLSATHFFGPDATPDSVNALAPDQFMGQFLNQVGTEIGLDRMNFGEAEVLGEVREGEVIHLVTRTTVGIGELSITQMEVVSMKPHGDSFALLLSGQIDGIAKMLSAKFRQTQEQQAAPIVESAVGSGSEPGQ